MGWWLLWRGPDGRYHHRCLFPVHPYRDALVGFVGLLDVTGGVEGGGNHSQVPLKRTCPGALGHHRTWGGHTTQHIPATSPCAPQIKRIPLKIIYKRHRGHITWRQPPSASRKGAHGATGTSAGRDWADWDQFPRSPAAPAGLCTTSRVTGIYFPQMLIFILAPIGRVAVPKDPKSKHAIFREEFSYWSHSLRNSSPILAMATRRNSPTGTNHPSFKKSHVEGEGGGSG